MTLKLFCDMGIPCCRHRVWCHRMYETVGDHRDRSAPGWRERTRWSGIHLHRRNSHLHCNCHLILCSGGAVWHLPDWLVIACQRPWEY